MCERLKQRTKLAARAACEMGRKLALTRLDLQSEHDLRAGQWWPDSSTKSPQLCLSYGLWRDYCAPGVYLQLLFAENCI